MKLYEILTLVAIVLGPILAVQVEKFLQRRRDDRNRRVGIFKVLMATRGAVLSATHVEALNRIDLEFSDEKKYQKVIAAWKEYFDNLGQKFEDKDQLTIWSARNEELLANLLYEMGQSLGYKFDKVLIKRNIYSPVGHANLEYEQERIRKMILEVLSGEIPVPMTLIYDEETMKRQELLNDLAIKYYKSQIGEK